MLLSFAFCLLSYPFSLVPSALCLFPSALCFMLLPYVATLCSEGGHGTNAVQSALL